MIKWGVVPSSKGLLYGVIALISLLALLSVGSPVRLGYSPLLSFILLGVFIWACVAYYKEADAYVRLKTNGRFANWKELKRGIKEMERNNQQSVW